MYPWIWGSSSLRVCRSSGFIGLLRRDSRSRLSAPCSTRLQDMDLVHPEEPGHRARRGVQVAEDQGLRRTHLDAGGEQTLRNPVVAEGALVGGAGHRVEVARPVRARLD